MPCYAPLTLYPSLKGPNPNGKTPLVSLAFGDPKSPIPIPCSRCIGCRLERSKIWAVRCLNEAQLHEQNCFITLTYDDNHVPCGDKNYTLVPRDLQLFFKRFRKKCGELRFYACGEYGDQTHRPHYHACVFGYDFPDKVLHPSSSENPIYTSKILQSLWPYGYVTIGAVTFESAAYVARYIMKKQLGRGKKYYEKNGIEPEFVRMSRKPGIGLKWYELYKNDVFPHDYMVIRNGVKIKPPKYYYSKYELTNPIEYAIIKEKSKKEAEKRASENTRKRLNAKRTIKIQQITTLKRSL